MSDEEVVIKTEPVSQMDETPEKEETPEEEDETAEEVETPQKDQAPQKEQAPPEKEMMSFKDWKTIKDAEDFVTNPPPRPRPKPQKSNAGKVPIVQYPALQRPPQFPLWSLLRQCSMNQMAEMQLRNQVQQQRNDMMRQMPNAMRNQMQFQRNQMQMRYQQEQYQQEQYQQERYQQQRPYPRQQRMGAPPPQQTIPNPNRKTKKPPPRAQNNNNNNNVQGEQIAGTVKPQVPKVKNHSNKHFAGGPANRQNRPSDWVQKPTLPPPMSADTPESQEEKQRMWREYRQAMKPFKHREFANAKRTIQRLGKKPESELDEKEKVRLQKAQEECAAHKALLSQRSAVQFVRAQDANSSAGAATNASHKKPQIFVQSSWINKNKPTNNGSSFGMFSLPQRQGYPINNNFVSGGFLANNHKI